MQSFWPATLSTDIEQKLLTAIPTLDEMIATADRRILADSATSSFCLVSFLLTGISS